VQIVEDHGFVTRLEREVADSGDACEAIRSAVDHYRKLFSRIEDPYFRERGDDVEDVGRRVMAKLLGVRHRNVPLAPGSVVVTSMILPAHFTMLEMDKVAAIVAEHGGSTSHGAIFARTLEIPAVTGVEGAMRLARPGETAIVDGTSGRIYLAPDDALLAEYRRAQQRLRSSPSIRRTALRPRRPGTAAAWCSRRTSVCSRTYASSNATAPRASGSSAPSCWRSPIAAHLRKTSRRSSTSASRTRWRRDR
jgi:phosphoenolpyruvate-protein kinase (PTS system EI component)